MDHLQSPGATARLLAGPHATAQDMEDWKAAEMLKVPLCSGERIDTPGIRSVEGTPNGHAKIAFADPKQHMIGELSEGTVLDTGKKAAAAKKPVSKKKNVTRSTPVTGTTCTLYAGSGSIAGGYVAALAQLSCTTNNSVIQLRSCLDRKPNGGNWTRLSGSCRPQPPNFAEKTNANYISQASYDVLCYSAGAYRNAAIGGVLGVAHGLDNGVGSVFC